MNSEVWMERISDYFLENDFGPDSQHFEDPLEASLVAAIWGIRMMKLALRHPEWAQYIVEWEDYHVHGYEQGDPDRWAEVDRMVEAIPVGEREGGG